MEELLSLDETSQLLKVSKQTLRNWDKSGKLKAIRTDGNQRRYSKESVYRIAREKDKRELFKKMNGEKWYIRDFDYLPDVLSDRTPWIDNYGVIECFKKNIFKWFDTYDECAKASCEIRKLLGINDVNDEYNICQRGKEGYKSLGYQVD